MVSEPGGQASAAGDTGSRRRRHRLLAIVRPVGKGVVALLALLGAYLLLATFLLHGPVNEWSLLQSVSAAADSPAVVGPACETVGSRNEWNCIVIGGGGSGSGAYRVSMKSDSSCWTADLVRDQAREAMPKTLSGCVRRIQSPF